MAEEDKRHWWKMNRVVSNRRQLEKLVELMEESPDVARGMLSKAALAKKWKAIALELNSLGPPQRDPYKWQRVWVDQKSKIKKKITNNKIEMTATGGGSNNMSRLSDTEEAVNRLMNFTASVDPTGVEFGLELPNVTIEELETVEVVAVQAEEDVLLQSPNPSHQKSSNKQTNENKRLVLLENQTSAQDEFYNKMINIMSGIQTKLESNEKSIRNIEYYFKKTYNLKKEKSSEVLKIKKEKLQLYMENKENKENDRKIKLELKKQILELEQAKQNIMNDDAYN